MLLLILVVALLRELVPSLLTTLDVVEVKTDCLTVIMMPTLLTARIPRMLGSDAVEDVSL